jgi:heparin binding hemagglutinin HbhA
MSVTHVLEYPTDIVADLGESSLDELRRGFQSKGWKVISWGVDSHDAIEFTIYRDEDDRETFLSLYLAIAEDGAINYALEALVERGEYSYKFVIESGKKDAISGEDIEALLSHGATRSADLEAVRAPLLAAVGAADLALERVNEIVSTLRERAGEARSDAEARFEESRAPLAKLQEELPSQFGDLRERLSPQELRKFAESYADAAQTTYNKLVERGEAALERLRNQPPLDETDDVSDLLLKLEASVRARRAPAKAAKKAPAEAAKKMPAKAAKKLPAAKSAKQVPAKAAKKVPPSLRRPK